MAGTIKRMLDTIVAERSRGNPLLGDVIKTKLILKGLNPARYDAASPDDPAVLAKVRQAAAEFGVTL